MTQANRQSVAYQIYSEPFESDTREKKKPELKAVATKKKKKGRHQNQKNPKSNPLGILTPYLCVVAVVCVIIVVCNMQLTQLSSEISRQETKLEELQAENVSLSTKITSGQDLTEIEQKAIEMGMVKMDNAQIEYVEMTQEDTITVKQEHEAAHSVVEGIAKSFSAILEYIR